MNDLKSQLSKMLTEAPVVNNNVASADGKDNFRKAVKGAIGEIIKSQEIIESEKEHIEEILKKIKEEYAVNPKVAKKVAHMKRDSSKKTDYDKEYSEVDELFALIGED